MKTTYDPRSMTNEEVITLFELSTRIRNLGSMMTFIQEVLHEHPGKDLLDRDVFSYAIESLDYIEDTLDVTLDEFRELMTELRKCRVVIDPKSPSSEVRYREPPAWNGVRPETPE
jgi:hypothetical protein